MTTEMNMRTVQILRVDVPNGNGRIYPLAALEQCVEKAKAGPIFGVLGLTEGTSVDLSKVSHTIENLRIEGEYLVGDVTILHTPEGKRLDALLDGVQIDFRPTGTGVIREGLITNYNLISIDAVFDGVTL
jgi:hypothetical protein